MQENPKTPEKIFKILDKSKEKGIITTMLKRSKRSEVTGRICSSYYSSQLLELFQSLKISYRSVKIRKDEYCFLLEWYLREYHREKRDGKDWFFGSVPQY